MPVALRIFLLSLFFGGAGGYAGFRLGVVVAWRLAKGEYREAIAMAAAVLSALLIGTASAVTAGVLAGRKNRD